MAEPGCCNDSEISDNSLESVTELKGSTHTGKQEHISLARGSTNGVDSIHKEIRFKHEIDEVSDTGDSIRKETRFKHEIDEASDTGDPSFRNLLDKLAQMHESVLQELTILRAQKDIPCQHSPLVMSGKLREAGGSQDIPREMLAAPLREQERRDASDMTSVKNSVAEVSDCCSSPEAILLGDRVGEPTGYSVALPCTASTEADDEKEDHWTSSKKPALTLSGSSNDLTTERVSLASDTRVTRDSSVELFKARPEWSNSKQDSKISKRITRMAQNSPSFSDSEEVSKVELIVSSSSLLRHVIAFPASRCRTLWDVLGAALIFWDLAVIPLNISLLAEKESSFLDIMDWITLVFWTLNMPASLLVGYVQNGVTVMAPYNILINYLKTWFVLDLLVVVPDWIFTIAKMVGSNSNAGDSVKLLRILRLARCMRLLRLAKLRFILASINDLINSEYTSIIANIFKMILALLACNHFIGCLWFLMAELSTGRNWVKVHSFDEEAWTYQYATSFHWSITQFTPSSMHVQPQNLIERTFAVTVVVFGLVGFSYLVGSITGSLTELRKMNSDMTKQFWNLRRYLNQNRVPTELAVRIQKYLEHQWQMRKVSVMEKNVTVLEFLSEQLKNEMRCAMVVPSMLIHPLFEQLNEDSFVTMQRLANKAIEKKLLAAGDSLFHPLETATHMSFVVAGKLQYIRMFQGELKEWVDRGEDWIAEPVLWTASWYHRGHLIAAASSELMLVNVDPFPDIIKRNPQAHQIVSGYAIRYIARLNEVDSNNLSDITQGELETDELRELLDDYEERSRKLRAKFGASKHTLRTRTRKAIQNFAPDPIKNLLR